LVSNGEFLTFSMAISNQVGGTVTFSGFTEIDFNFFTGSDSGVLSIDNSIATVGDNFFTTTTGANIVDISGTSPTLFSAIAAAGGAASNSFRVDDVSGRFVGVAAVPEASSFIFGGLICTVLGLKFGGHRFLARVAS
jgi:hypothetical protein